MSIITILPSGQIISVSGAASSDTITVSQDTTDTTVVTINQGQQGPAGVSITVDNYGNNRITTSDGTAGGLYAESDLTFDGSKLRVSGIEVSISGHTHIAANISDFNEAVDDRIGSGLFIAGTGINLSYNDGSNSFTVSTTGVSFSGHTHQTSDIIGISGYINSGINIYFSGLSTIGNNCDVEYIIIQDSGNNTKLISISGVAEAIAVIDGGGVLYSGC